MMNEIMKKLNIDCILLAAGESHRMGLSKQLIQIKGKPILRHSLELALRCCTRVIIVQGAVDISSVLQHGENVEIVHNNNYQSGQLGSLQVGITRLESKLFFVLLADLIHIMPQTFFKLAKSIKNNHVVYPFCNDKRGHPVLMDGQAAQLIRMAQPDEKAMDVIEPLKPMPVPVNDYGIFTDIDTKEDLNKLRKM